MSNPDWNIPLRASEYKNCCHRHQLKKGEPPGPVLCVVLYHGREPWKAPFSLGQWLKLTPEQESEVGGSISAPEYFLLDLSAVDVEQLELRAFGKMVLALLKSILDGTEREWLRRHVRLIDELLGETDRAARARTLIRYCLQASALRFSTFQKEFERLPYPRTMKAFKSTADQLIEEGWEQGLEKGLEKGLLIGQIRAFERVSKREAAGYEDLAALSLEQLQNRLEQLEKQLFGRA